MSLAPYALFGATPALLGFALWPAIRKEWAQIIIIMAWLTLAVMACLAIAFVPMALLFMCAPAAASMFEKEKVIESMLLAAILAALIYYLGHTEFFATDAIATETQSSWGVKAAIAGTIAFLIAAMYGAADSARYKSADHGGASADVLDAVPGGLLHITPDDHIAYATDTAHALFALPNQFQAVPARALFVQDEDRSAFAAMIDRARRLEQTQSQKFKLPSSNGAQISAEVTATAMPDDTVLIHVSDTSAHEARVQALHAARTSAQKETEGKTLFFAGVSHELRTPLNAIIGFSDMMRSRLFGPLPGKYAEYADLIHDSGQHMLDLIGDVLDLAKVEAGKYELVYSAFDAANVVRSSIKMIRPTADAAEVRLDAEIFDDPAELLVEADRKALRQILLNLLSNAIKFSPKGGRIVISALTRDDVLKVSVRDSGVGISKEELAMVGQPYVQTASGKNSEERGSGLGLSLVKSLCELHGGRFSIKSEPGKGTIADIYLPATRRNPVSAKPSKTS